MHSCILALWLFVASASADTRPPTVDDLLGVHNVTEAVTSPNGHHLVFGRTETDLEANTHAQQLWISRDRGDPELLSTEGSWNATPHWLDDTRILFQSDRVEGANQIFLRSIDGADAQQITSAEGGVQDWTVSADGRWLAFTASDPAADPGDGPILGEPPGPRSHAHLVGIASGETRRLTEGAFHIAGLALSPDGSQLAVVRQTAASVIDEFTYSDLHLVDTQDGTMRPLVARPGMDASPVWSPDGSRIAFFSHDGVENWIGTTHLCVVDVADGAVRNLTPQVDERIYGGNAVYAWAPDGASLWFARPVGIVDQLLRIDPASGATEEVGGTETIYIEITPDTDGRHLTVVALLADRPGEAHRLDIATGDLTRLTTTNPQLEQLTLPTAERHTWTSSDGRPIEGVLFRPTTSNQENVPLLVALHGGPSDRMVRSFTPQTRGWAQWEIYPYAVFAAHGFAVLCPNFRGSTGYGSDFLYANVQDWGYGDLRDVLAGVDSLVDAGLVDTDRVGVMGWSYGGTLTAFSITQTDRFAAASVGAGVTNHIAAYGSMDIPPFLEAYFGGAPGDVPENYLRSSAVAFLDHAATPTLLLYGEMDRRVPLPQGKELYRALLRRGITAELAVYPRSGHSVDEPRLQKDLMERNLAWFERWLGADRPERR